MTFKTKIVKRDREDNYIMINESIQQQYVTIVNIYLPNLKDSKYIQQILTHKREKRTVTQY